MKTKKVLAQQIIMTVLAAGFLGYVGYIGYDKNKTEIEVSNDDVSGESIVVSNEETTVLKSFAATSKRGNPFPIYSATEGNVKRLVVSEGQQVQKGDLLAIVTGTSSTEGLSVRKSESLEYIQQLKNILKNLEQSTTLGDVDNIAITDEQKEYHRVKEALKRAEANHSIIVSEVETRNIFSPISGIVQNIKVNEGGHVGANSLAILEIKPFQSKEISFTLTNDDYRLLQDHLEGANAVVVSEAEEKLVLTAEELATLKAFEIDENNNIQLEMRVNKLNSAFKVNRVEWDLPINAIVIPETAILKEGEQYYVWKLKTDNSKEKSLVDVITNKDGKAFIRKGLNVGEKVIKK
ncbi:MAG: efflux RND transporter periplasmic adaptor subunit [Flavobacteriaceae bacterium]|jgi:membrane fusion protein (multidrug efflux system)|nr:efflux RND transporter periplasmic adaptor subunit [Flavobacteriaceae bacterium]